MKILYVENHEAFAQVVSESFLADFDIERVSSVAIARNYDLGCADLVLVDYDLDDGKGSVFVEAARASGYQGPIIAVSSHQRGNEALLQAGANASCAKRDFHQLRQLIDDLLSRATP